MRVGEADAGRVSERFRLLFLVQSRHREFLDALERDTALLHRLARDEPYELRGIGFFARRPREAPPLHWLRSEIAHRLGAGFLDAEETRLAGEIAALARASDPDLGPPPEEDRYPRYPPTLSERAEGLYTRRLALEALREEWPLREGALVDAKENERPGDNPALPGAERRWLMAYRQQLVEAVVAGFKVRPADDGALLLLAIARFLAVSESLATDRLLVLDALPAVHRAELLTFSEERRGPLVNLLHLSRTNLDRLRGEVFGLDEPDQAAYNQIEHTASQIAEIRRGLASGQPMRFLRRPRLPEGWGMQRLTPPPVSPRELERLEAASRLRSEEFRKRLGALYPYDLIGRNCVTELVRVLDSAFDSPRQAASALGGYLKPGEHWGFVPHRFFELVQDKFRVENSLTLPSYRNRGLRQLAERGDAWSIHAAESNTWTSSLYDPREGDTLFLLFTEEVFWPRPLYGAVNLAYGLAGAGVGVLAAPFDQGRLLREGLWGAVFSLPELTFGNIRKGSFDGLLGHGYRKFDEID